MKLENQVAVISGAAQGIGLAIAKLFAAEGARVMLLDVNDVIGAKNASKIINAEFFTCDVSQKIEVNNTVEMIFDTYGKIDICVNNAAILRSGNILEISEEDFDSVIAVNLKGACSGCPSSSITLKSGIETLLKQKFHPDIEVLELPTEPFLESMNAALAVANRHGAMRKTSLFRQPDRRS